MSGKNLVLWLWSQSVLSNLRHFPSLPKLYFFPFQNIFIKKNYLEWKIINLFLINDVIAFKKNNCGKKAKQILKTNQVPS